MDDHTGKTKGQNRIHSSTRRRMQYHIYFNIRCIIIESAGMKLVSLIKLLYKREGVIEENGETGLLTQGYT
jgi:hypothetical protein